MKIFWITVSEFRFGDVFIMLVLDITLQECV